MERNGLVHDYSAFISTDLDEKGTIWYVINGLDSFILEWFRMPSLAEMDRLKERIGATEARWVSSHYGFKTEAQCEEGIVKLLEIAENEATPCYHEGHELPKILPAAEHFVSCQHCKRILGYVCAGESPSIICEYDEENDPCCDNCFYCGEPAERK